jgi:hypothetical protein
MSFHARTLTLPSLRRRAHPLPQIPERGPDSPLPDWDRCKTSSPSRLATLAPLDEEVLGGLILRCEGEARASKDEVAYYAMIPDWERVASAKRAG